MSFSLSVVNTNDRGTGTRDLVDSLVQAMLQDVPEELWAQSADWGNGGSGRGKVDGGGCPWMYV
jgi:hypothetical protein